VQPAHQVEVIGVEDGEEDDRAADVVLRRQGRATLQRALDGLPVRPADGIQQSLLERERLGCARLAGAEGKVSRGARDRGGERRRRGRRRR
jgi:hypothetical protein